MSGRFAGQAPRIRLLPDAWRGGMCRLPSRIGAGERRVRRCRDTTRPRRSPWPTGRENNSRNTLHKHCVQLASARAATKAGIDVDVVDEQPMTERIRANGEVLFDPTRVAHLSSRVAGNLAYVAKTVGDEVRPGEILALVDAAQVGTAKSQLLHAVVQYRLKQNDAPADAKPVGRRRRRRPHGSWKPNRPFKTPRSRWSPPAWHWSISASKCRKSSRAKRADEIAAELRFLGIPADLLAALPAALKTGNLLATAGDLRGRRRGLRRGRRRSHRADDPRFHAGRSQANAADAARRAGARRRRFAGNGRQFSGG